MFNAILRSKLLYGLDTMVMNTGVLRRLDVFQMKGLRKMLEIPTTYIDHQYSNAYVHQKINEKLQQTGNPPIITLSEYHKKSRIKFLIKLINEGETEPCTAVTFNPSTLLPLDHGKKRVGQPRLNWFKVTIQDLWELIKTKVDTVKYASALNLTDARHVAALRTYAEENKAKDKPTSYPRESIEQKD